MSAQNRDVLTPHEIAERSGFSYHAILRLIRRGDLQAFEPVPGRYRIEVAEYERWRRTPLRGDWEPKGPSGSDAPRPRARRNSANSRARASDPGSHARLSAIENTA